MQVIMSCSCWASSSHRWPCCATGLGRYVYNAAAPLLGLPEGGPAPLLSDAELSALELDDPDAGRKWPHGDNVEGTHLTRALEGAGTQV